MRKVLLYIWQLPQNLLGLLVILFTRAKKNGNAYYLTDRYDFGVSLGDYIIFGRTSGAQFIYDLSFSHEYGHQKQSLYLGWLYLIIIGLPSILGNIWDRLFHRKWNVQVRIDWYYSQPWEAWADRLGGVIRW